MSIDKTDQIVPAFQFGDINQSVVLSEGPVSILVDGNTYTGNAEAQLDLLPRAHVNIYCKLQGIPTHLALACAIGQKKITSFVFKEKEIAGFLLNIGGDASKKTWNFPWCPRSEPIVGIGDESTKIENIIFHVFNFKDINLNVHIEAKDWLVELVALTETRERIRRLDAEGGYALTHIGSLKKKDESSFTGKQAEEMLGALRFFISFAKGTWCNPVCAVGFDGSNNRVWELWSSPKEAWQSPMSWFDPYHCEQLATLFPGFMAKCNHKDWREALHEVIYWYLNSNHSSRGIDAGIILTQAAIERLSYEYVVKDRKLIEANGFKNLRASDKFRLLFSSLDIPIDIPTSLSEMTKFAGQFNWLDSPHALTEMRNSLVHPEHKRGRQYSDAYFEAWNLGLWYLELALLRICGYVGSYCNRLNARWVGTIEDVPWQQ